MKLAFYKHIELDSEKEEIIRLLQDHDIPYEISTPEVLIDKVIVGDGNFANYTLKLLPQDFEKTNALLKEIALQQDVNLDDYKHLMDLKSDELLNILIHPSDWSIESVIAAEKILKTRGVPVDHVEIEKSRNQNLARLREGKDVHYAIQGIYFVLIVLGFVTSIVFTLVSIGAGFYYTTSKSTDYTGKSFYSYDSSSRQVGQYLIYIGIVAGVIQLLLLIQKALN